MSVAAKYLIALAVAVTLALASLAAFNWWMNPHHFFSAPQIPGFNQHKTYTSLMRMRKPVHIYQRGPEVLIVGSSRAGEGFHCEYIPLPGECYNAAIRGITPYEEYRLLEHAVVSAKAKGSRVQRVFLNLGFATFTELPLTKEGYEDALLARETDSTVWGGFSLSLQQAMMEKIFYALFSREALEASRNTLKFQNVVQGWFSIGVLSFEYDGSWRTYPLARAATDHQWVHQKNSKMWGAAANAMTAGFKGLDQQLMHSERYEHNYTYFAKLLELAYREHIVMDIILSPAHVDYMRAVEENNLWAHEEQWKRRIVQLNEQLATQFQQTPYPVWDFGGFNPYSLEPAWEQLALEQRMRWYKDVVHFSEELGALILDAVLQGKTQGDWYTLVNSDTIDQHLQHMRAQKDDYFARHPSVDHLSSDHPAVEGGAH